MNIGDRIKLLREKAGISQARLAELSGLGIKENGASRISHYELGRRSPNSRDLELISNALSKLLGQIDPGWLQFGTGIKPLFVNDQSNNAPLGFVQILNWNEISDSLNGSLVARSRKHVPMFNEKCSQKAFALKIKGDAMKATILGNPSFNEEDVIICDPEIKPNPGDFVIAKQNDKPEPILRQLIEDQGSLFLKPMNHQYPLIPIDHNVDILASLVAHIRSYR